MNDLRTCEQGQVAALLMLIFQIALFSVFYEASHHVEEEQKSSYLWLEQRSQRHLDQKPSEKKLWGQNWAAPPPRIDYGAFTQHRKDAEALCFFHRFDPALAIGRTMDCD